MTHDDSNNKKARRYAFALERTNKAIKAGYYLEAITLCESMISDRLLSSLARREKRIIRKNQGLGRLIEEHRSDRSLDKSSTANGETVSDIFVALGEWKKERNELLHGFAKCVPGDEIGDPVELMERAKDAADEGLHLFRLLDNWHRKHTRNQGRPDDFDAAA